MFTLNNIQRKNNILQNLQKIIFGTFYHFWKNTVFKLQFFLIAFELHICGVFGLSAFMWNNLLYKLQIHVRIWSFNRIFLKKILYKKFKKILISMERKIHIIWILQKYNNDYNLSKLSIHFKKALVFDISLIFFNPKYHFVRFIIIIGIYRYLILWKISSNEKFDMLHMYCTFLEKKY